MSQPLNAQEVLAEVTAAVAQVRDWSVFDGALGFRAFRGGAGKWRFTITCVGERYDGAGMNNTGIVMRLTPELAERAVKAALEQTEKSAC